MAAANLTDFDVAFASKHVPVSGDCNDAIKEKVLRSVRAFTRTKNGKFWIGMTSGEDSANICRRRWNDMYKGRRMNRMAIVYEYEDRQSILDMKAHLKSRCQRDIHNPPAESEGNLSTDSPLYLVFIAWNDKTPFKKAFRNDHQPIPDRGKLADKQTRVLRSVRGFTRNTIYKFWVGKTSSDDEGCRTRWNGKYTHEGMNKMARVYSSNNQQHVLDMERYLIKILPETDIANDKRAPPGRLADEDKTPFIVYIAWKE